MSEENNYTESKTEKPVFLKKPMLIAFAGLIAVVLGIILFWTTLNKNAEKNNEAFVATVNGEKILEKDFNRALEQEKMQYAMQGMDLDSTEMADTLQHLKEHVLRNYFVIPTLLVQNAKDTGILINQDDIDERYQQYALQFGGEDQLKEQMARAEFSYADLEKEIIRELTLQRYFQAYMEQYFIEHPEDQIKESSVEISMTEVENYYTQIREAYTEMKSMLASEDPAVPVDQLESQISQIEEWYGNIIAAQSFDEVKNILRSDMQSQKAEQVKQEQEEQILMAHIEELEQKSTVETFF